MFGFFRSPPVSEVPCAEALAQARRGDVHLVDVREQGEWAQGHVEGSLSAPLSSFDVAKLPADKPLVFLCLSGQRSASATRQALAAGLSCRNVAGGLTAWRGAGLPMHLGRSNLETSQ